MDHVTSFRSRPKLLGHKASASLLLLGLGERLAISVLLSGAALVGVALALASA